MFARNIFYDIMTTRSISTSVLFGIIAFLTAFSLGSILTITTGIPLVGGLFNGVLTGMVLTIGMISRRYVLSGTTMWLAFALCATMTTTLGPPGIYKIAIGGVAGILWDIVFSLLYKKKKVLGLYLGGLLGSASIMFTMIAFLRLGLGENAMEALQKYESKFYMILTLNLIITAVGIFLGHTLYQYRLSKLTTFKNISNSENTFYSAK